MEDLELNSNCVNEKIKAEILSDEKMREIGFTDYDTLKEIHKKSFCDMRFGQFMIVVFGWIQQTKGRDPFFPEEDEMIKLIKEYANTTSMWFREN